MAEPIDDDITQLMMAEHRRELADWDSAFERETGKRIVGARLVRVVKPTRDRWADEVETVAAAREYYLTNQEIGDVLKKAYLKGVR